VLFGISIWKGDVDLVSWCIDNNYGSASTLITNSHISLANQLGFNMETISDMVWIEIVPTIFSRYNKMVG